MLSSGAVGAPEDGDGECSDSIESEQPWVGKSQKQDEPPVAKFFLFFEEQAPFKGCHVAQDAEAYDVHGQGVAIKDDPSGGE